MESMREMIEKRAYQLFLKRGGAHGYHMQDWVQAEKEIAAEIAGKKKADIKQPSVQRTAPRTEAPAVAASKTAAPIKPAPNAAKKMK